VNDVDRLHTRRRARTQRHVQSIDRAWATWIDFTPPAPQEDDAERAYTPHYVSWLNHRIEAQPRAPRYSPRQRALTHTANVA
jgi:hypothetical protein